MKPPKNSNFERMRLDAERRRLAELEEKSAALQQALTSQGDTGNKQIEQLEARCAELTAELNARTEAEKKTRAELEALRDELALQAQAEREVSKTLEARCDALTAQLGSQAAVDEQALAKLESLRDDLKAEAEGGRSRAADLDARVAGLSERVTEVDASFTNEERLREAVAPILSGAMRDAGIGGHDHMASAIAPYVVETIRTEILNSEDELIEAIHPKLGVLIASAVSNAVEELNRKVDAALPIDRWMASIKGKLTGAPAAGFLLDDGTQFSLQEAMLIERQSGLLLAHERAAEDDAAPDEDLMAGMIAALQSFAEDAYGNSGAGELRRFSFTTDTVYLRASPTKLLAVRCSGVAPPEIERRVDALLVEALERLRGDHSVDSDGGGGILMIGEFNAPLESSEDDGGVSASSILKWGLGGIAASILAIWMHGTVQSAHQERWFDAVRGAALADASLGPYPLSVTQEYSGGPVRIAGLVPTEAAREALETRLDWIASPLLTTIDVAVVGREAQR